MAHFLDALGGAMVDPACPLDWSHPLNQGLVADYTIIPNPGWRGGLTLRDLVRGGHNPHDGVLTNMALPPTATSGWQGQRGQSSSNGCLAFDGTNDFVNVGNNLAFDFNSPFSLGFWYQSTHTPTAEEQIAGKNLRSGNFNGYWLSIRGDVGAGGGGTAGAKPFNLVLRNSVSNTINVYFSRPQDTAWHFVAATYDGSATAAGVKGYVDGLSQLVNVNANTLSSTIVSSANFQIGAADGTNNPFTGLIGSGLIYNRGLAAADVAALYVETKLGNPNRFRWLGRRSYSYPSTSPPPPPAAANQNFLLMGCG